jgi:hypothetical protein
MATGYWHGLTDDVWTATTNWWDSSSGSTPVTSYPGTSVGETAYFNASGTTGPLNIYLNNATLAGVYLNLNSSSSGGISIKGGTASVPVNDTFVYATDATSTPQVLLQSGSGSLSFDSRITVSGSGQLKLQAATTSISISFYGPVICGTDLSVNADTHFYGTLTTTTVTVAAGKTVFIESTGSLTSTATNLALTGIFHIKSDLTLTGSVTGTGFLQVGSTGTFRFASISQIPSRATTFGMSGGTIVFNPGGDISRNFSAYSFQNGPAGEYNKFNTNGNNIHFQFPFGNSLYVPFGIEKIGVGELSMQLDNTVAEVRVLQGTVSAYGVPFAEQPYGLGSTTSITMYNVAGTAYKTATAYSSPTNYVYNLSGGGVLGGNLVLNEGVNGYYTYLTASRDNTFGGSITRQGASWALVRYPVANTLTLTRLAVTDYIEIQSGTLKMGQDYVLNSAGIAVYARSSNGSTTDYCCLSLNNTTQSVSAIYETTPESGTTYQARLDFGTNSTLYVASNSVLNVVQFTLRLVGNGTISTNVTSSYAAANFMNPFSTFTGTHIIESSGRVMVFGAQFEDSGCMGDPRNLSIQFNCSASTGGLFFYGPSYVYDFSANFSTAPNQYFRIYAPNTGTVTLASPIASAGGKLYLNSNIQFDASAIAFGTLRLLGANTYTDGTYVTKGELAAGTDTALGTGAVYLGQPQNYGAYVVALASTSTSERALLNDIYLLWKASDVYSAARNTIRLGNSVNTGRLLLGGTVYCTDAVSTTVEIVSDVVLGGGIQRTGDSHTLIKQGSAKLTIASAVADSGSYQVDAGTLEVTDIAALGTAGDVAVLSGATLSSTVPHTRINGRLTVFSGGSLSIG